MRLIGKKELYEFKKEHADARKQTESWEAEIEAAEWKTPHELKMRYPKADTPGDLQVIFDICHNRYRIWAQIDYQIGVVLVKGAGTHKEYEKWQIKRHG